MIFYSVYSRNRLVLSVFVEMKCKYRLNILQAFVLPVDIQTRRDHFSARRRWQLPIEKDGSLAKSLIPPQKNAKSIPLNMSLDHVDSFDKFLRVFPQTHFSFTLV